MDINKLVENYFAPKNLLTKETLWGLFGEVLEESNKERQEPTQLISETGVEKGYKTQALRIPRMLATEISVGQKPGSEARQMMELWFRNIKPGGTLEDKIAAIANFVRNPPQEDEMTIAETLSYLMFLQSFAYILKEFNPSVAGYLWEPLLAVLFGGKGKNASVQVPTTEHDISDIRIFYDEQLQPISLKILRKEGPVGGSFKDLVKFFSGRVTGKPEPKMTYVVIAKVAPRQTVNTMVFYKFELTRESFMDWIGHKKMDVKTEWAWKNLKFDGRRRRLDWATHEDFKEMYPELDVAQGYYISSATTKATRIKGGQQFPWLRIFTPSGAALKNASSVLKLKDTPVRQSDELILDATYEAYMPIFKPGGHGGRTLEITNTFLDEYIKKAYEIWGSAEDIANWQELAADPNVDFFGAIIDGIDYNFSDGSTHLDPPPGLRNNVQFEISANFYRNEADNLGSISIDDSKIRKLFQTGAQLCGENLTNIFNSLAALTDNVARFFLVDCGNNKCTDTDAANRAQQGAQAGQNAALLKASVDIAVNDAPEGAVLDQGDGALTT